jgi:hypothetical protein
MSYGGGSFIVDESLAPADAVAAAKKKNRKSWMACSASMSTTANPSPRCKQRLLFYLAVIGLDTFDRQ